MTRVIDYRVDGRAARLILDSPHNRNALSTALVTQLHRGLRDAVADPQVRLVVLGHTGGTFCAGADLKAVAAGEADIAVVNTYYYVNLMRSKRAEDRELVAKVGVVFPNQANRGTHVNISGAALVRSAPNRDNAVRFLEYLTTPEAQRIFALGNMEYPVVEGVALHPALAAMGRRGR